MPLQKLLEARAFDAETSAMLTAAYRHVLATLGVKDRADPITRLIAETIVAIAEGDVHNRNEIYERTIAQFSGAKD
jgi:hypothetical protein